MSATGFPYDMDNILKLGSCDICCQINQNRYNQHLMSGPRRITINFKVGIHDYIDQILMSEPRRISIYFKVGILCL